MVMSTNTPQGVRINPQNTLELSQGMSIQTAIDTADAHGGFWTILLYPGMFYDEGDITPGGTAIITIKGMGQNVTIRPTAAPATAVINMTETLYLENLTVIAPDATRPAVLVNTAIGVPGIRQCNIIGIAPGYSVQMTQGSLDILYSGVSADVHLSTLRCVLDCYQTSFFGDIITAAEALNHDIDLASCNMTGYNIISNATGATVIYASHTGDIGTVTNAGTGLFTFLQCYLDSANCTNAAGEIQLRGGSLSTVTRAVGTVVWWRDSATILVLPSATITDTMITYALAAASAAGGKVTIRLATGDYEEDNMTLVDDVNIVGEGHTAASGSHITINSANPIFTAGAIQSSLRHLRITQAGAGAVFVINNAAAVVHTDDVVFGSTGGNAVTMTAGTYSTHGSTSNSGNYNLSTAACTLICHSGTISGGNIVTAGAFGHTVDLNGVDMSGGTITNGATGVGSTTTINIWCCYNVASFTDASQLGTVTIEDTVITSAAKSGTSPWTCRISHFGLLSNTNATGAITVYMGEIYALVRAVGPIVWWQDTNTLKVIPSGTITDTIIQWAVNAAGIGDTVLIHPGTYQEAVTLAAGRNLVGLDRDNSIINGTDATLITMAAGCRVANLTLNVTAATGNAIGIEGNDSAFTAEDLNINLVRTGANAYGINENTGATARVINIRNVRITSDTDSNEFGVYIQQANKTVYIEESWIQGGDYGIALIEDSDVFMYHNRVEVNARPLGGGAAIYTNHADAVIRMHGDTVDGMIYRLLGTITYKNNAQQYEVWQGAYDSVAATTLHHGMLIQDAIDAAAAETPAPGTAIQVPGPVIYGYITYTVLVHPGLYDEPITCGTWVNLKGIGPKGSVVIQQADATIISANATRVEIEDLTVRLVAPTAANRVLISVTNVPLCRFTNVIVEVTDPDGQNPILWQFTGTSVAILERCYANIGFTNSGITVYALNSSDITIDNCAFEIAATGHRHLRIPADTAIIRSSNTRYAGTARLLDLDAGTVSLSNDTIPCTGAWGNTDSAVFMSNCSVEAPIVAGNGAVVRLKNCSYRAISRTGTGNIVDESPYLSDAPWHVEKWSWQAALANAQVAVRGTPIDAGSGQVQLEVTDNVAGQEAVESLPAAAGALDVSFLPARTPRCLMQIAHDAFDEHTTAFYGLRHTLGDAIPNVAAEECAGFDWDGANFRAISSDGVTGQTTNLTTPTVDTHVQLEVIVFGGLKVEFYVDGVLVATHSTLPDGVPDATLDWQHLLETAGADGGDVIQVTVRNGGCQSCPA